MAQTVIQVKPLAMVVQEDQYLQINKALIRKKQKIVANEARNN